MSESATSRADGSYFITGDDGSGAAGIRAVRNGNEGGD
jgi:hypothetical protein